jgi:hypothetical protein
VILEGTLSKKDDFGFLRKNWKKYYFTVTSEPTAAMHLFNSEKDKDDKQVKDTISLQKATVTRIRRKGFQVQNGNQIWQLHINSSKMRDVWVNACKLAVDHKRGTKKPEGKKEGTLLVKNFLGFSPRFFVLKDGTLTKYQAKGDLNARSFSVQNSTTTKTGPNTFKLTFCDGKELELKVKEEKEMNDWIAQLEMERHYITHVHFQKLFSSVNVLY